MRDIKFRFRVQIPEGFDKKGERIEVVYQTLDQLIAQPSIMLTHTMLKILSKDRYTGLKGKNGVEVYESDIVRILYTDWASKSDDDQRTLDEYLDSISHIGKVVFNPYYGWRVEDVGGINHGEHGRIAVIGNIYENPELLEKSNG